MADDLQGKSLDELRDILAAKHTKLEEVRGLRLQADQDTADAIAAAQLRAEIARVDQNISLEVSQLEVSLNQDPDAVGAGTLSVAPPEVETAPVNPDVKEGESPTPEVPVAPVPDEAPPVPAEAQNPTEVDAPVETPVASEEAPSETKGGKK